MPEKNAKLKLAVILSVLVISGFLAFGNSLNNPLFWDDEVTIVNNVFIRDIKYLREIFTSGYHQGAGEVSNLYRPLAVLSFLFEYRLWGLDSFVYHLDNLVLHILNVILLFFLSRLIFKKDTVAFLAAILYLVHPQATEVVNYASHRPELLMALFSLLTMFFYIKFSAGGKRAYLALSLFFYCLAILAKEMGIILILFIFLYNIFRRKKAYACVSLYALPLAAYLVLRATLLNFLKVPLLKGPQLHPYSESLIERLLVFGKSFLIYLKILFIPLNLHMERDLPGLSAHFELPAVLGLLFILAVVAFLVLIRKKRPHLFFAGLWFILGLVPVSGIIPINTAVAEHYLYLPAIGFFMLAAFSIDSISKKIPVLKVFFIIMLVILAGLTVRRNKEWNDPLILYASTAKNARQSFRAHNNLGVEYFRRGDLVRAEEYFRKSLDILPTYAPALNNAGVIFEKEGKLDEAIIYYKESVKSDPGYLLAYRNLAYIYLKLGREKEAKEQLDQILKRYPFDNEVVQLRAKLKEQLE